MGLQHTRTRTRSLTRTHVSCILQSRGAIPTPILYLRVQDGGTTTDSVHAVMTDIHDSTRSKHKTCENAYTPASPATAPPFYIYLQTLPPRRETRGYCVAVALHRGGPARTRRRCWGRPETAAPLFSPAPLGEYHPSCSAVNASANVNNAVQVNTYDTERRRKTRRRTLQRALVGGLIGAKYVRYQCCSAPT